MNRRPRHEYRGISCDAQAEADPCGSHTKNCWSACSGLAKGARTGAGERSGFKRPVNETGECDRYLGPLQSKHADDGLGQFRNWCSRAKVRAERRFLDYSRGTHALKGHGFSRAVRCAWRVGLQPLREFARRGGCQHRSPSVAKATIMRAAYGTAEAVPLQSLLPSTTETDESSRFSAAFPLILHNGAGFSRRHCCFHSNYTNS
jgi:hypothetical protein